MKTQMKHTLSLREAPFFRTMSAGFLARIEDYVYHREYAARQIVFFPDDSCDHVYWVREGRVKTTKVSGDRRELTLRYLLPGDVFGEECLIEQPKRDAYAEAMVPTVLCLMSAVDFRRTVRDEKEMGLVLAQRLCQRVHEVEQVLADTVFKAVRGRVASGLLRLYRHTPHEEGGPLRVTHQELADLVGSTRETTTSVLHGLQSEGVLKIANRRLTVLDPVALERAARSG